jgi:hypothetical protein
VPRIIIVHDLILCNAIHIFALSIIHECTNFPQMWEPFSKSRRQKGDIKTILNSGRTNNRRQCKNIDLVAGARDVLTPSMT